MRYALKLSVLTVGFIWLSHLEACMSSPRDSHAENQGTQQSKQPNLNNVADVNKQEQKQSELDHLAGGPLTSAQVKALVEEEFGGLFGADDQIISPDYLVGDFNGDGVADIAIPVRLTRSIDPSDKSEPSFWFGKPLGPGMGQDNDKYTFRMGDLDRYRNESILIVLHGITGRGWGHSEPKQRFVIVDAWDAGKIQMASYRGKLEPAAAGDGAIEPPPRLLGNAILMLGHESKGTALYWDGNRYRWFPVDQAP